MSFGGLRTLSLKAFFFAILAALASVALRAEDVGLCAKAVGRIVDDDAAPARKAREDANLRIRTRYEELRLQADRILGERVANLEAFMRRLEERRALSANGEETEIRQLMDELVNLQGEFVNVNHPLLLTIAGQVVPFHDFEGFDDLLQHGRLGLQAALHGFDASKGIPIGTWASMNARWKMGRAVQNGEFVQVRGRSELVPLDAKFENGDSVSECTEIAFEEPKEIKLDAQSVVNLAREFARTLMKPHQRIIFEGYYLNGWSVDQVLVEAQKVHPRLNNPKSIHQLAKAPMKKFASFLRERAPKEFRGFGGRNFRRDGSSSIRVR